LASPFRKYTMFDEYCPCRITGSPFLKGTIKWLQESNSCSFISKVLVALDLKEHTVHIFSMTKLLV